MSDVPMVRVGIGQLVVERSPVILKTTLGSCVGVAMLWPERGCYGLAHCLLPESPDPAVKLGARYVDQGIAALLASMGAEPEHYGQLEAHLAGGGNMLARSRTSDRSVHVGQLNIEAAVRALEQRGIAIRSQDVGGCHARQMVLDCVNGTVSFLKLPVPDRGLCTNSQDVLEVPKALSL